MDEGKNLTTILSIIDTYWERLTSDLTQEELSSLKKGLSELETKMQSAKNIDEINENATNFYQFLSKFEPLKFLIDLEKMRGGSLPELEEEIRIKIINICVTLQNKIES